MNERGKWTAARPFHPPLRSSSRKLVPTTYAPTWPRDTGRYDSSERLPDIEALFDRTLNQVRHIHEVRQRNPKPFDKLWEQVCKKLEELKNASAYSHWKQRDIIRNADEFTELDNKLADAWAQMFDAKHVEIEARSSAHEKFSELQAERAKLTAVVRGAINDALEIAIAYWIEARNAHNNGDHLRALNCLIEAHFYLGITYSPKTDYEAKSEAGRKAGLKERDALAEVILVVMNNLSIDKSIRDQESLRGKILELIQADPAHAEVLQSYDAWATNGKHTEDSIQDRFSETLRKWLTGKIQPYKQVTALYRHLCRQMEASPIRKRSPRKGNG